MTRSVALVYVRKSFIRAGQADAASPELQAAAAAERATALGLTVEQHTDADGHRSGKTSKRAGWQAVMKRLADADVGALIVYSHDRAWRNLKELLNTADECVRLGVKFILVKDGVDVSTAQGRFLLSLLGSFAEFESNIGGERRAAAIDWVRRVHGQHMGMAPFGTARATIDGHLRLVASEQLQPNGTDYAALLRVYTLYAAGEKGYTLIVEQLNREGWRFRSSKGLAGQKALRPWTYSDVRRVLHNHWLYAGWIVKGRAGQMADFELIQGNHGAVLPAELTETVAARLDGHPRGWRLPRNISFSLSGLVWCECGAPLTGLAYQGRRYYRHARTCAAGQAFAYWADDLEADMRARLKGLNPPPDFASDANHNLPGPDGVNSAARHAHLEVSLERARELYIDGHLTRSEYDLRRQELTAALAETQPAKAGPSEADLARGFDLHAAEAFNAAELQLVARAFYERVNVSGETRCAYLDYRPKAWCQSWA